VARSCFRRAKLIFNSFPLCQSSSKFLDVTAVFVPPYLPITQERIRERHDNQ
jgi:hypothetical protein